MWQAARRLHLAHHGLEPQPGSVAVATAQCPGAHSGEGARGSTAFIWMVALDCKSSLSGGSDWKFPTLSLICFVCILAQSSANVLRLGKGGHWMTAAAAAWRSPAEGSAGPRSSTLWPCAQVAIQPEPGLGGELVRSLTERQSQSGEHQATITSGKGKEFPKLPAKENDKEAGALKS